MGLVKSHVRIVPENAGDSVHGEGRTGNPVKLRWVRKESTGQKSLGLPFAFLFPLFFFHPGGRS